MDAAKRVLTKEKIDRQLSGQSGATTPFMKWEMFIIQIITVSFRTQDPIREQLDSLTSMVYNIFIQKEENNLSPKYTKKKKRPKLINILEIETEIDPSVG